MRSDGDDRDGTDRSENGCDRTDRPENGYRGDDAGKDRGDATGGGAAGWFIRRAGLARFTTFACALGFALSAFIGAQPVLALLGLMASLAGALVGSVEISRQKRRASRPASRNLSQAAAWLVLSSVLLTGMFGGYLAGGVRVAALVGGTLQARVGEAVEAELCLTGQVRSYGGWQSVTAVARTLRSAGSGRVTALDAQAVDETLLLEVPPPDDKASESLPRGTSSPVTLDQGMIIVARGIIERPDGPSSSGYDQARRLLHQGIEVVFRAESAGALTVVGHRGGFSGRFDRLRASARSHLSLGPSDPVNEVLQGVVMGDTLGIDQEWMTAFRRSGTAHMLSVSGLHVASLAAIMMGLARVLGAARWVGFLMAMVSALLMIPFVGASPPIVRAAVMICVVLTGRWLGRGRDQWQVLGLAAVVVLALNPFAVFDVGFQLSFAAFVGMLALLGPLERGLRRLPDGIRSNVAVSIAASAGTAPISLAVFDQTSLVSPLANLLVVPTLPAVTGLGMASAFLGFAWSGMSIVLDALASLPMMWTIQVSRLMAVAPVLSVADLGRALLAVAIGLVTLPAALALAGHAVRPPPWARFSRAMRSLIWIRAHRPGNRRLAATLSMLLVLAGMAVGTGAYPAMVRGWEALETLAPGRGWPDQVEVRVLDIGQGNAVLVRTPEHHALLFDGGPAGCGLGGRLRDLGVRTLDLVVISHPHADHFAGLLESLDGLEVDTLIDQVRVVPAGDPAASTGGQSAAGEAVAASAQAGGEEAGEAADYLRMRRDLAGDGCRYVLAATGHSVKVDGLLVRFYAPLLPLVLASGPDPWSVKGGEPSGDELNAASLVAVVSFGEVDVLIPGDAEAEVLERYDLPPCELVVVPHHGSRNAVTEPLLAGLEARAAVVSVGEGNYFGHPDAGTMALLQKTIGTVFRTDLAGWVSCTMNEDRMVITSERTSNR